MARALNNTHSPTRAPGLNLNDPNELIIMIVIIVVSVCCGDPTQETEVNTEGGKGSMGSSSYGMEHGWCIRKGLQGRARCGL